MEAWVLPHLTESPIEVLYKHGQLVISRFESCEITLKTGLLRILPLNEKTFAIEGLTSKSTRRFLLSVAADSWKLSADTSARLFHDKLGERDTALLHLANAIRMAYRTGRIQKISNEIAIAVRAELIPKPVLVRGEAVSPAKQEDSVIKAWATVDELLQSPTTTKRFERALTNESGKIDRYLLITFQEQNHRFILERIPVPRSFDSRPTESITITKNTISHFDPDGAEPFSTQERALEVFAEWMALWNNR
jgi:hypothetical protein